MTMPFLLRYAKPCASSARVQLDEDYAYDETIDMTRWLGSPDCPPVIEAYDPKRLDGPKDPPTTKKCDLEKGEDQKDRRMWMRR